jgi:hypothetical protein
MRRQSPSVRALTTAPQSYDWTLVAARAHPLLEYAIGARVVQITISSE